MLSQNRLHRVKLGAKYLYLSEKLAKDKKHQLQVLDIDIEEYYDRKIKIVDLIALLKAVLTEHKIDFSLSTIGMIAKRFLDFCKLLHKKYEYKIKEDIRSNGGYVAHYDGTTEKKCGVINFVVMDSLSEHILISEMIESENYTEVTQILRKVKFKYGNPLTTVSDLKPGFLSASKDSFNKNTPHKFCDYHFLRTFKDIFVQDHNFIKKRLCTTWKITSSLRKQLKSINQASDKRKKRVCKNFKDIEKYWKDSKNVLETYRLVLLWILKFKQASSGKGIPFDLPYLDLYERLIRGKRIFV